MATTINSGSVDTADPLSDRLIVDMLEPIQMLDTDTSQFSTMLDHPELGGVKLASYLKTWIEDRLIPRALGLSATAASDDTNLKVTTSTGAYAKTGDLIRVVTTGECVRVTAAASSSLTVTRGVGGTTAASAASGVEGSLVIIGHSTPQGASLPTRLITKATKNYNYGQIQRKSWGFTRTARQSDWYSSGVLEGERDKKASEFKEDRENTLFFGARSYTADGDSSGHPLGTAGGLIEFITTNVTSVSGASGALSTTGLENFITTGLQYAKNPVLFAAPKVGQAISHLLSANWVKAEPDEKVYGAKVTAVISGAFGDSIPVIVKKQWGRYGAAATGFYSSLAFLVDMADVRQATMQAPVRLSNRQANDFDGIDEEYLSEETLVVSQEIHHSLLKDVTGAGT